MTLRLLLLNPNTSREITDLVLSAAEKIVAPGTELVAVTASYGVPFIGGRETIAIAATAALDAFKQAEVASGRRFDAVLLACFGDPGLAAIRQAAGCPVVSFADSSCVAAAAVAEKFSVITGGSVWVPILQEFFEALGYRSRIASIRAVAATGAEIAANPDAALAGLAGEVNACIQDGAQAVILGGAGLAGVAARLAARTRVPLIDSVAAGVIQAEALARLRIRRSLS